MDNNGYKRITVKVGTSTLTYQNGKLNLKAVEKLVRVISDLKNRSLEIILVSSGAIGVGFSKLGLDKKPESTREKQASAAIGQCELMYLYDKLFSEYNYTVGQILLTRDVIENNVRKQNVINTFDTLLQYNCIPVVNENDTVSTEEIEFGDNDYLSAVVAAITNSDLLVFLTDTDGLYDKKPSQNNGANLIPEVTEITDEIRKNSLGSGTDRGTGGMATKIIAAEYALNNNINTVITNGSKPELLYDIIEGRPVGTIFKKST